MFNRIKNFASLYLQLGPRWSAFRVAYAFRLRTGLIRLQMPMGEWSDYKHLIKNFRPERRDEWFFRPADEGRLLENISWDKQQAITEADRILNGEIKYFAHEFIKTGFPPSWQTYPVSSLQSPQKLHWSQISDDSTTDIKFIWEPNRFAFVYTLVRAYVATHDEKYPEAFWSLIEDWAKHNPPNTGPNWMDGQEIALRFMAWTFGYFQFSNSPSSTPDRKAKFILLVAAQANRIYKNIGYAISTRSNHTISEAFGLWMVGLLFPELKHAEKYLSLGRKLLEQSAAEQIFPDGTYSMYSLNYHRFILQTYLYAIRLGELNNLQFSNSLYSSIASSLDYLSHLISPQTGEMPVYGSNDGALVLPLNNCDFTDYRPLLQLGWYITKKEFLFEPGPWDEDIFWLCGEVQLTAKSAKNAKEEKENLRALSVLRGESFPNGGVYLLHSSNSRALIHCTDYTSRPSHADQLHVDLWIYGHNVAIDAGTYLYSGHPPWRNGLTHTSVHNTVTVDNKDQMTMVSRFTWTNWSNGKVLKHDKNLWQGEHDGYKPVTHKRTVISLEGDRWLVIDNLNANKPRHFALHWLLADLPFEQKENLLLLSLDETKYKVQVGMMEGKGNYSLLRADPTSTRGWRSRYYGHKEPAISVMLEANQPQVAFWSFFGLESDSIEWIGDMLKINSLSVDIS
ncbi:MAG: alginate lyase family protein [Anaerolineales bacterium]|nr:alginate lyase family protein [Anaerolineales bacterium]